MTASPNTTARPTNEVNSVEKITAINEVTNVDATELGTADGYEVITDKQRITVLIDNGQNCCENYGYLSSEDDLSSFVGASLLDVKLADTQLNDAMLERNGFRSGDEFYGGIMFVTFETDRGPFQLVAYNEHNGYYGHQATVKSEQLTHSETL